MSQWGSSAALVPVTGAGPHVVAPPSELQSHHGVASSGGCWLARKRKEETCYFVSPTGTFLGPLSWKKKLEKKLLEDGESAGYQGEYRCMGSLHEGLQDGKAAFSCMLAYGIYCIKQKHSALRHVAVYIMVWRPGRKQMSKQHWHILIWIFYP